MYKLIYMKADYEPWWQFEGWEQFIVFEQTFTDEGQFQQAVQQLLSQFRERYEHEMCKEKCYYAFWSDDETEFCEACDDDAQIYHGILALTPEKTTVK